MEGSKRNEYESPIDMPKNAAIWLVLENSEHSRHQAWANCEPTTTDFDGQTNPDIQLLRANVDGRNKRNRVARC